MEQIIDLFRKNKLKKVTFEMAEDNDKIKFKIIAFDRDDLSQNIGVTKRIDANMIDSIANAIDTTFPILQSRLERRKLETQS